MAKKTDNKPGFGNKPIPGQPAMPTTSNTTKPSTLGQGLRIAGGGGGIGSKELKNILETTGKSQGQVIKQLDKINTKLGGADKTGINLKSGAVNYLTNQASKQSGYDAFKNMLSGESQFGTGRLGQALQGMVGDRGFGGTMIKGQLGGVREPVARTILPRGMDLMPSGRQTVRGIGKPYEVPGRLMQPSIAATTEVPTAGVTPATGDTTMPTAAQEEVPAVVEPTVATTMDPFQTALANWSQGFRRKQSSRQKAGRGAQGLGSQRVAPQTNTLGV